MTYRLYGNEETDNNTKKGKHTERKRATKVMETVTERKNTHIKWFIIFFLQKGHNIFISPYWLWATKEWRQVADEKRISTGKLIRRKLTNFVFNVSTYFLFCSINRLSGITYKKTLFVKYFHWQTKLNIIKQHQEQMLTISKRCAFLKRKNTQNCLFIVVLLPRKRIETKTLLKDFNLIACIK